MLFSVIAPGFHALYLESMVKVFTNCSGRTISKFEELLEREGLQGGEAIELNLEAEFSSLALDIIGLGVFNYDFGSVTKESPIIKVWLSSNHSLTYSSLRVKMSSVIGFAHMLCSVSAFHECRFSSPRSLFCITVSLLLSYKPALFR